MLFYNSLFTLGWALTHRGQAENRMTDYGFSSLLLSGRLKALEKLETQSSRPFPCKQFPYMCTAPLNCHEVSLAEMFPLSIDGHANLRTWCNPFLSLFWESLAKECIVNSNLEKSGNDLYDLQSYFMAQEVDASYCFLEGHCSNMEVNPNTTIEEAEKMCDKRFGHDGWTGNFFMSDIPPLVTRSFLDTISLIPPIEPFNGIHEQKFTRFFAKLACVMGNYHCDVQYCKQTYCQIKHYQRKYMHLLPSISGHEIQDFSAW